MCRHGLPHPKAMHMMHTFSPHDLCKPPCPFPNDGLGPFYLDARLDWV